VKPTQPLALSLLPEALTEDGQDRHLNVPHVGTLNAASTLRPVNMHPMQSYAPQVAQQIATASVRFSGATTEIALNPEELGRVRIAMTTTENGMTVSIISERPETTELMRRNIELLAREFKEIGHSSVSFSFDGSSDNPDAHPEPGSKPAFSDEPLASQDSPHQSATVTLRGGLDLKL